MCKDPQVVFLSMEYASPSTNGQQLLLPNLTPGTLGSFNNNVCTSNCIMQFRQSEFQQLYKHTKTTNNDNDNLIVFSPKADDNTYKLIYYVIKPVYQKTGLKCVELF